MAKDDHGREEKEVFAAYLAQNRLKRSDQREVILDVFLRSEQPPVRGRPAADGAEAPSDIGRTTVYRTLKLLQSAGLAQELVLQGQTRFEREYKRHHHDHFICKSCGAIFEFSNDEIERIQEEIATDIGFVIDGHRHQIFGRCKDCVGMPFASTGR